MEGIAKEIGSQVQQRIRKEIGSDPLVVLGCFDPRYCFKQRHVVREVSGLMTFDSGSNAGFVHMLANPRPVPNMAEDDVRGLYWAARRIAKHNIELAIKFHDAKSALLTTHHGCGHLKHEGWEFSSEEEEQEHHRRDRLEASAWVRSVFPNLTVWSGFYYLDGDNRVQMKYLSE